MDQDICFKEKINESAKENTKETKCSSKETLITDLNELSTGDSSIDSNIEILNQDEIKDEIKDEIDLDDSLSNKENVDLKNKIKFNNDDANAFQFNNSTYYDRSIDRSKTSIDDLSFSQKTLIKSYSLRSLITDLINDEILLDKNEISKDLDEYEKEKFFQIIKVIKQEDSDLKIEQLKELCKFCEFLKIN